MATEQSSAHAEKLFSTTILERFEDRGITEFDQIPGFEEVLDAKDQERFDRLKAGLQFS